VYVRVRKKIPFFGWLFAIRVQIGKMSAFAKSEFGFKTPLTKTIGQNSEPESVSKR